MTRKTTLMIVFGVLLLAMLGIVMSAQRMRKPLRLPETVAKMGAPNFIATTYEIDRSDPKVTVLRMYLDPQDPITVANWDAVRGRNFIWANSAPAKRSARYYYQEMSNDSKFDGTGWYSTRSIIAGEQVEVLTFSTDGICKATRTVRVDAFAMRPAVSK